MPATKSNTHKMGSKIFRGLDKFLSLFGEHPLYDKRANLCLRHEWCGREQYDKHRTKVNTKFPD